MVNSQKIPTSKTNKEPKVQNFKHKLEQVQKIITNLEDENPNIDKLLVDYKTGNALIKECEHMLKNVKQQVEIIDKDNIKSK